MDEQRNCYNETQPVFYGRFGLSIVGQKMGLAELALQKLESRGINIKYLNITHLSEYRKDAHPSIYKNIFHTLNEEQLSNPTSYSDVIIGVYQEFRILGIKFFILISSTFKLICLVSLVFSLHYLRYYVVQLINLVE